MVGLSVILENYRDLSENHQHLHHHVIRKGISRMIKSFSSVSTSPTPPTSPSVFSTKKTLPSTLCSSASGFLEYCFLCRQKLLDGKDIYMYKGDRAFCSEECRYRHILMDEEDQKQMAAAESGCTIEYTRSMAATSSSSSATDPSSRRAKGSRNNGFAY